MPVLFRLCYCSSPRWHCAWEAWQRVQVDRSDMCRPQSTGKMRFTEHASLRRLAEEEKM
jgi:hypothetical protein